MRYCPFNGCGAELPEHLFACRLHWQSMSLSDRQEINDAYTAYMADDGISLTELRQRQQAVLGDRGTA